MELDIHDESGKVVGKVSVDKALLAEKVRPRLLREAVLMYIQTRRNGSARTKTKGERQGSGAKPWRQKGTGRARVGTVRSPLWRKGGVIHGPKPRDYGYRIPKKARRAATRNALLAKLKDAEVVVIDKLSFDEPKTGRMAAILSALGISGSCLITVMPPATDTRQKHQNLLKSIQNIPETRLTTARDWNAYDLIRHRRILLTRDVVERLAEVLP